VVLEERLDRNLPVHAPPITEEELLGLDRAASAAIDRQMTVTVAGSFQMSVARDAAERHTQWLRGHPPLVLRLTETVFGTEVELGRALGTLPDVDVIQNPLVTDASGLADLRVVFSGSRDIACRVLDDDEQPPSDAVDFSNPPGEHELDRHAALARAEVTGYSTQSASESMGRLWRDVALWDLEGRRLADANGEPAVEMELSVLEDRAWIAHRCADS
jgi:hypothetical protein